MLHTIGRIEDASHGATPCVAERVEKHAFTLLFDRLHLREESILIDDAFIQRPRVLSHSDRGERAKQFSQIRCVIPWLADGERWILRIDLYRCRIYRCLLSHFRQQKSHEAVNRSARTASKRHTDPRRVLAKKQGKPRIANLQRTADDTKRKRELLRTFKDARQSTCDMRERITATAFTCELFCPRTER